MAELDRYLRRFRRMVSPPGRPGPAAVPADRAAELASELAPLFASIDDIDAEAGRILRDADEEIERIEDESRGHAQEILSRAREQSAVARAEAIAKQRDEAEKEIHRAHEEAAREADRIRRVGRDRIPDLVDEVIARIREAALDEETA